jgi:hypothetical protein
MMFEMRNRKPQSRFQSLSKTASRRWNRMLGRELTPWQRAGRLPMQAGDTIKSRPWMGAIAAMLLLAGLAFTFGRRFWPEV